MNRDGITVFLGRVFGFTSILEFFQAVLFDIAVEPLQIMLENPTFHVANSRQMVYNIMVGEGGITMKINEKMKQLRLQLHLSQDYVAKYLGVNRSTFTQMENGQRRILADEISKICTLFGVSADTLINGTEISQPTTVFARSFENLDENDQAEIMNLIRFKEQMKAKRGK